MKISINNGFLHKIYLGITYPVRHPVVCLLLLLAFFRHELFGVWQDYQSETKIPVKQIAVVKRETSDNLKEKLSEMRLSISRMMPVSKKKSKMEYKKEDEKNHFASWNIGKFNKVKYEPAEVVNVPLPEQSEKSFSEVKQQAEAEKNMMKENRLQEGKNKQNTFAGDEAYHDKIADFHPEQYYVKNTSLNLEYLQNVEYVEGEADIVGPNSMFVDDIFVFLYGLYSDPRMYDTRAAEQYLENITKDKTVSCYIVALSLRNDKATALCFVDDVFINKALTENGLAQNVALQ